MREVSPNEEITALTITIKKAQERVNKDSENLDNGLHLMRLQLEEQIAKFQEKKYWEAQNIGLTTSDGKIQQAEAESIQARINGLESSIRSTEHKQSMNANNHLIKTAYITIVILASSLILSPVIERMVSQIQPTKIVNIAPIFW